jgi:hypothetical protein
MCTTTHQMVVLLAVTSSVILVIHPHAGATTLEAD